MFKPTPGWRRVDSTWLKGAGDPLVVVRASLWEHVDLFWLLVLVWMVLPMNRDGIWRDMIFLPLFMTGVGLLGALVNKLTRWDNAWLELHPDRSLICHRAFWWVQRTEVMHPRVQSIAVRRWFLSRALGLGSIWYTTNGKRQLLLTNVLDPNKAAKEVWETICAHNHAAGLPPPALDL